MPFKKASDWVGRKIIKPIVGFAGNVASDIKNYDSGNQSEEKELRSNYFSSYKGVPVIKTPFKSSFSFGFIGLSSRQQNANTLKHEYGHALQLKNMGICRYIVNVAIPSVTINRLSRLGKLPYDYYTYPWEAEANRLGGSTLSQSRKPPLPQGTDVSMGELRKLFKAKD